MITEWFISLGTMIADWFIGLIPDWDVPPEILTLDETINDFFASFEGLGVWVPWVLVAACVGIAITTWVIGITVKGLRAVASYIPFFGGSG